MTKGTTSATESSLHDLLVPVLAEANLELIDIVCTGLGTPAAAVEIRVDHSPQHPLGGRIDLEGVSVATRIIDTALEAHDPIAGGYTLEVSSPGLERPLRTPDHFRRFLGTVVSVKTVASAEGERRIEGRLDAADTAADGGITVAGRAISYADIERARTVFVWGPQPKPGTGSKPGKVANSANSPNAAANAAKNAATTALPATSQHPHKQATPQRPQAQQVADHRPGGTR